MNLDDIDAIGLIREAYNIDGIRIEECRSIFLDWALKLPMGVDQKQAIKTLLATYGGNVDHPMTSVLSDGLQTTKSKGRRGGRSARISQH